MSKSNLSPEMYAGRINHHGKVASLTSAFSLDDGGAFSICVVPDSDIGTGDTVVIGSDNTDTGLIVNCKTYHGDEATGMPVFFNQWSEAAIVEISAGSVDLDDYNIYWGACSNG